ncbi:MAG TPA: dihydrofolate reductase family protein [Cyclobacteriaceae bacterium]|nr:dihydrofolate reductase family protein [Cyclobacteriaceae bacterium]
MRKVILEASMSLDGFSAGSNINAKQPLGENGEQLHDWMFGLKTDADVKIVQEIKEYSGAVIVGGKTYHDAIDIAWGGVTPFKVPAFVITHRVPKEGKLGFTFVSDGIERALLQARAAAGDKNVWVMGGANTIQQFVNARLFDELRVHIAPVLLGGGTRLFDQIESGKIDMETKEVIKTPGAIHLKFYPTN